MSNINFNCPKCDKKDKLILMGELSGTFEKECKYCNVILELKIHNKKIDKAKVKENKAKKEKTKVPKDYKKYDMTNFKNKKTTDRFWVNLISFLILSASLMGLTTGGGLYYAPDEFTDSKDIKIYIVITNETSDIEKADILINNNEINQTYIGNGTHEIFLKAGKYNIRIISEGYKMSTMNVYIPVQDADLSLIDYSNGLEGINRFTFELEKGEGTKNEEENTYLKMLTWCPSLILLFSLIGLWGSWITYTLQSYKNAQIGAFFSIMAMGFLIIGPILGIIALILLPKIKKKFTGPFKK